MQACAAGSKAESMQTAPTVEEANTPPPSPPFPECTVSIEPDAVMRCRSLGEEIEGSEGLHRDTIDDLDGDGVPETLLACMSHCGATGNCPFFLYLSHRGCARYGGELAGAMWQVLAETHFGLHDVETWWKGGCAGMEGSFAHYSFDGTIYQDYGGIQCSCPLYGSDGEVVPDPSRDPSCPSVE